MPLRDLGKYMVVSGLTSLGILARSMWQAAQQPPRSNSVTLPSSNITATLASNLGSMAASGCLPGREFDAHQQVVVVPGEFDIGLDRTRLAGDRRGFGGLVADQQVARGFLVAVVTLAAVLALAEFGGAAVFGLGQHRLPRHLRGVEQDDVLALDLGPVDRLAFAGKGDQSRGRDRGCGASSAEILPMPSLPIRSHA